MEAAYACGIYSHEYSVDEHGIMFRLAMACMLFGILVCVRLYVSDRG